MRIRTKKLAVLAAPFLLAPAVLIGGATAASAAITTDCDNSYTCHVYEDMGNGFCEADVFQVDANGNFGDNGNFAFIDGEDYKSGYTCNFFFQRNVNNTGWYNIDSFSLTPTTLYQQSPNEWNGAGYQARACLQFNWGSSLGAVHCSSAIRIA